MVSAQHASESAEHGTPPELVELVHETFGDAPDVDPASSHAWNGLVQARRVITAREDGTRTPWFAGAPVPSQLTLTRVQKLLATRAPAGRRTVILNPPGDPRGELVALFWRALAGYFALDWCSSAIYVGFNVEQLARLQRVGAASHPLDHVTLVPAERFGYRTSPASLAIGEQPPHASFVSLLTRSTREIETFVTLGRRLGHVINGNRR